jgi:hypothetical protein
MKWAHAKVHGLLFPDRIIEPERKTGKCISNIYTV